MRRASPLRDEQDPSLPQDPFSCAPGSSNSYSRRERGATGPNHRHPRNKCAQPTRAATMVAVQVKTGTAADPIVTRLVEEDKVPWYKKPNLRLMYICLFLCCMGVEITSGFDSQLINTLQFAEPFKVCKVPSLSGLNSCFQCTNAYSSKTSAMATSTMTGSPISSPVFLVSSTRAISSARFLASRSLRGSPSVSGGGGRSCSDLSSWWSARFCRALRSTVCPFPAPRPLQYFWGLTSLFSRHVHHCAHASRSWHSFRYHLGFGDAGRARPPQGAPHPDVPLQLVLLHRPNPGLGHCTWDDFDLE